MVFSKTFRNSCWFINLLKPIILLEMPKRDKNCIKSSFVLIIVILFHIIAISNIKMHITEFSECKDSFCRKRLVMLIIWIICFLMMWYSLILKRLQVKRMFREYAIFRDNYRAIFKRSFLVINILTFLQITILTASIIANMIIFFRNDELTNKWYDYIRIFEAGIFMKRVNLFFYFIYSRSIFVLFPGLLSLLHLTLFMSLNQALSTCNNYVIHCKKGKHVEDFINTYSKIHKMATSVESAISLEMIFMISYQYSKFYLIISSLYEKSSEFDIILLIDLSIRYLQNLLHTLSIFVAANVHVRDLDLKAKIKDVAFRMSFSKSTLVYSDLLNRFIDSKTIIIFTAWKMFSFTRTFIITSFGVFFTYTMLFLQLPDSDK